jgi:hypothetical protein
MTHTRGICDSVRAWLLARWRELEVLVAKVWRGIKCAVGFTVDVGVLVWSYLFDPDAFELRKVRFVAQYLTVRVSERVLAREFARALAA